jgi:hypothetical protein
MEGRFTQEPPLEGVSLDSGIRLGLDNSFPNRGHRSGKAKHQTGLELTFCVISRTRRDFRLPLLVGHVGRKYGQDGPAVIAICRLIP